MRYRNDNKNSMSEREGTGGEKCEMKTKGLRLCNVYIMKKIHNVS